YTTDTEYDYEVNAETGEIESKEIDTLYSSSDSSTTNVTVELDTAKNTVLKDAGVSNSNVTFTKEKLDREKGTWYYDLEFYTTDTEYDYEVNAETGEIIGKEVEYILSNNGDDYIGIDAAKEIVLKNADISANDVIFTKAKLEKEDGIVVYEIEFIIDTVEYENIVQASDGTILEYDIDHI
ncbi:MAG: PepSY domain-containing protein, partial [Ruminococcus sp.]|nr:PepSY domain-containing protein [Ruminococcus sp.]